MNNNEIGVYDWLNFFESKSNHWIFRYWKNNRENFFDRFMIIGDKETFIIADKEKRGSYEFKKPNYGFNIRFDLERIS